MWKPVRKTQTERSMSMYNNWLGMFSEASEKINIYLTVLLCYQGCAILNSVTV